MITAVFRPGERSTTVRGLWQWDYGQTLEIKGLDLSGQVEVHFAAAGDCITRLVTASDNSVTVSIPDTLLEQSEPIIAYIYLTDGTFGKTEYKIVMPVKGRPKPEGFKPDDTVSGGTMQMLLDKIPTKLSQLELDGVDETYAPSEQNDLSTKKYVDDEIKKASESIPNVERPDWDQNDESKPDYIKNRPFYTGDPTETVLVDNEEVVTEGSLTDARYIDLAEGETYRVTIDGTEYQCKAEVFYFSEDETEGMLYIGNPAFFSQEPAETYDPPFVYAEGMLLYAAEDGTHTITIIGPYTEIKKMPYKYMPYAANYGAEAFNGEKSGNVANGYYSHAEGSITTADGYYSHAEGNATTASGQCSHAEGYGTKANDYYSHAEGQGTTANGNSSHAEGANTTAIEDCSHAEGANTTANGQYSHAEGRSTTARGNCSHAEGGNFSSNGVSLSDRSVDSSQISGLSETLAVEGPMAYGIQSHAEGTQTLAYGYSSHAEGYGTTASGQCSHAEGYGTKANDYYSHAEGYGTKANGYYSHAEGSITTADGYYSHAEGNATTASGQCSHAEGGSTKANGYYSHAEGYNTKTNGSASHAEGNATTASGQCSHAEGYRTTASVDYQHVQGKYNVEDTERKYAHIVGNGTSSSARSNAHTLDWDGNAWYAGDVEGKSMIIKSSTEGSTKRFRITVDDSGTISAVEV